MVRPDQHAVTCMFLPPPLELVNYTSIECSPGYFTLVPLGHPALV